MYQWLLFDADNTLFDFSLAQKKAFKATFQIEDLPYSDEIYQSYEKINHSVWEAFERGEISSDEIKTIRFLRLFETVGVQRDAIQFSQTYTTQLGLCHDLIAGAEELLSHLSSTINLGLITNGLATVQRSRLGRSPIKKFFDPVIISEEVGAKKPEAKIFDVAFEAMGNPSKESVLMIGDSLSSDILGGINYGIDTCWYNPYSKPNHDQLGFTFEIQALKQLPPLVQKHV